MNTILKIEKLGESDEFFNELKLPPQSAMVFGQLESSFIFANNESLSILPSYVSVRFLDKEYDKELEIMVPVYSELDSLFSTELVVSTPFEQKETVPSIVASAVVTMFFIGYMMEKDAGDSGELLELYENLRSFLWHKDAPFKAYNDQIFSLID